LEQEQKNALEATSPALRAGARVARLSHQKAVELAKES
jgi:hypothetical protein